MGQNGQLLGLLPGCKQIRDVINFGAIVDRALLRLHVVRLQFDPVAGPLPDLVREGRPFVIGGHRGSDGLVVGPRALGSGGARHGTAGRLAGRGDCGR